MDKRYFVVLVPLVGTEHWLEVARCESPTSVAAVIQALCGYGFGSYDTIKVSVLFERV